MVSRVRVHSLHFYPVKSCRGISPIIAMVGSRGLIGDREWLVTDPKGYFITQRTHPRLSQVQAQPLTEGRLRLTHPLHPSVIVNAARNSLGDSQITRIVRVWDREIEALSAGPIAAKFFSEILETPAELVAAQPDAANFSDGYPLLITSVSSLAELSSRLQNEIPMARFRPNIVLEGVDAFEEDQISTVQIGAATFNLVKPCTRCIITSLDQETGVQGVNPLNVLRSYRYDARYKGVTFGQNAVVVNGIGAHLQVGDTVQVQIRTS